jgi:GNAT superfamily N-acetyltransferase
MIEIGSFRAITSSLGGDPTVVTQASGSPDLALRTAGPTDARRISEVAVRSKAYWGYDAQFMAACRDALTVRAEECDGEHVVVAIRGGEIVGYYQLEGTPPTGELADLFVDPSAIGCGVGGRLYRDALIRAHRLGFRELTIDSDPHAENFYRHMGAIRVGEVPSTVIAGRSLPRLRVDVPDSHAVPTSSPH